MKGFIYYVEGHEESYTQAKESLQSFENHKWDVNLRCGITKHTVKSHPEYNRSIIEGSRLHDFKRENVNKYYTKISCALNHVSFWKEVVAADKPMCFLEHDSICTMNIEEYDFDEYLILNAEWVFKPPNKLGLIQYKDYAWPSFGINDLPKNYPLKYHKENKWKGSMMAPGTGAYCVSPKGAKKLLSAIDKHGFDQSDFMINSKNVRMQYIVPSPVKFNTVNLSTSYGI